ncbi:MAG: hypothetical protein WC386_00870 [Candidatus Paceibacterota bacterium]|jgi:hypothetical protein
MAEELLYHDMAMLYKDDPYKSILPRFYSFLNNVSEKGGKVLLPKELRKSEKDIFIIEMVVEMVREYMVLSGRNKIIDISLPFVHLIPEGSGYENNSVFGGIVVERVANDSIFAINLFQKIFARMSFSAVKSCGDRSIVFIDIGGNFKEAVASLMSRRFFEEFVKGNELFKDSEPIIEEKCFDLKAEDSFNQTLEELWERNKRLFPKEKLFHDTVEATINGRILPFMVIRDRKITQEEVNKLLSYFQEVGTKLS